MTNSNTINLMAHLRHLSGVVGCRLVGTPGNQAVVGYIEGAFRQWGLEVIRQEIPWPDWREEETRLALDGEELPAYANTFSPACDVTAALLPLSSLAELEAADLAGRIPVFSGDLAAQPLSSKAFFFTPDRDRRIIQILEERGPAALIVVNPAPERRYRMIEDSELNLPSVTVTAEVGRRLIECGGAAANLRIVTRRAPGSTDHVIGRLAGDRPGRIVLCAHYDSKIDTTGAWDNAAGVSILLGLAETFARRHSTDRPTLEFVAFTMEEYYTSPEQDPYALENAARYGEMIALINTDGVGHILSTSSMATFVCSEAMEALVNKTHAGFPSIIRVDPWPASSHTLFVMNGVPSLAFSAVGPQNVIHTPLDHPEWISEAKLMDVLAMEQQLIEGLFDKDPGWTRG